MTVSYIRVSTDRQGRSGLGLEAQRQKVKEMATELGESVDLEFCEVQSGKSRKRPELETALHHCRVTGSALLVPKIDRLARDSTYLMSIYDSGITVHFGDMPNASGSAGRFMLQIMASVAEYEGKRISERTKEALAAAKRRGVKLGGYREGAKPDWRAGHRAAKERAERYAHDVRKTIVQLGTGLSHREIARQLTDKKVLTPRGGTSWSHVQVSRVLARSR